MVNIDFNKVLNKSPKSSSGIDFSKFGISSDPKPSPPVEHEEEVAEQIKQTVKENFESKEAEEGFWSKHFGIGKPGLGTVGDVTGINKLLETPRPSEDAFVIEVGEGLEDTGTKLPPLVYKETAEMLKNPQVQKELQEGKVTFVNRPEEAQLSQKAQAEDTVSKYTQPEEKLNNSLFGDIIASDLSVGEAITAPIRIVAGGLTRFITEAALEYADSDFEYVPMSRMEELLLGEQPIRRLSEGGDIYQLAEQISSQKLIELGVPENTANQFGFGGALMLGAIFENPFIAGTGKVAKEGAERIFVREAIQRIEAQTGEKLTKEVVEKIQKEVVALGKISDPVKRAEEAVGIIGKHSKGIDIKKLVETDDALKKLTKEYEEVATKEATQRATKEEFAPLSRPDSILKKAQDEGSFTFSLRGEVPTKGFVVSDGAFAKTVNLSERTSGELASFLARNQDTLAQQGRFLDVSITGNRATFDIKTVFDDQAEAIAKAVDRGQPFIRDLSTREVIETGAKPKIKLPKKALGGRTPAQKTIRQSVEGRIPAGDKRLLKTQIEQGPKVAKQIAQAEKRGAREGAKVARAEAKAQAIERFDRKVSAIMTEKDKVKRRRGFVRAVRDHFGLSDAELRKISNKDVRLMGDKEFKDHLDSIRDRAFKLAETKQAKVEVLDTIRQLELKKTDNLRKAMKLPTMQNMNSKQLDEFNRVMSQYNAGDEFLSQRLLETIEKTELKGVKTIREVQEWLSKKTGASIDELKEIKSGFLERTLYDTALAEKNPFYKLLVDEFNKHDLQSAKNIIAKKVEVNKLVEAARKSKKRSFVDRLIPTDEKVFNFMEADEVLKKEMAENMTKEELDLAYFLQKEFISMRDKLVEQGTLNKWIDNYITHRRRGFLEALKSDGFGQAMREVFQKQKLEQEVFEIIDDTGNLLPLEKFFGNAMHRSGKINPTKNVSAAYLGYLQSFEKKQALDAIVPEMMAYTRVLNEGVKTPKGLLKDPTLENFVKEWLNGKKGRTYRGFLRQGSRPDRAVRGLNSMVSMIDLGFSLPVSVASKVGENLGNFMELGAKKMLVGKTRRETAKGRAMAKQYANLIGENPLAEVFKDASKHVGDKTVESMFLLFRKSTHTANKDFFFGSLTKKEWESGIVSPERLAELKRVMGRYRVVDGAESVFGKTTEGKILTKYKTWAVPIYKTTTRNLKTVAKTIRKDGVKAAMQSKETSELLRFSMATAGSLITINHFLDEGEDDSFAGQIIRKAQRESLSLIGAMDPSLWSSVRLADFVDDLANSITSIVKWETYKTKEGLKGVDQLKKTITPGVVKQIAPKKKETKKKKSTGVIPKVAPDLPELPKLPKIGL